MSVIILVIVIFILVLVHEFGHYIIAKAFNIRVDEFGFGFPPRAKRLFKKGETEYTLNWIPFGGFVKIYGQDPTDAITKDSPDYKRSFLQKSKFAQACVLLAGVVFNFVFAGMLLSVAYMVGQPATSSQKQIAEHIIDPKFQLTFVDDKMPAGLSGLQIGDELKSISTNSSIVKFDKIENQNIDTVKNFISQNNASEINFEINNEKGTSNIKVKPQLMDNGSYGIGISADLVGIAKLPFLKSIYYGFDQAVYFTKETFAGFGKMIWEGIHGKTDTLKQVTGPVGMATFVGSAYQMGFVYLLIFVAIISISLAVINLMPFPALDGGRLLFLLIEAITFRKIPNKLFNWANVIGFVILITLMVVVTFKDIVHLVK